jgi:hypothetical protein
LAHDHRVLKLCTQRIYWAVAIYPQKGRSVEINIKTKI